MWQHTQETNGIVDVPFTLPTERSQDTHTGLIDALATQGTLKRKQRRRKVHALSKKKMCKDTSRGGNKWCCQSNNQVSTLSTLSLAEEKSAVLGESKAQMKAV